MFQISREISKNFPSLKIRNIEVLDEGVDSKAYLANKNIVFRFPKHREVSKQIKMEIRLLPELRTYLDIQIPEFLYVGRQHNGLPFVGYKYIPGEFLLKSTFSKLSAKAQETILQQIATFLSQVHSFPLARAKKLKVRTANYRNRSKDILRWFRTQGKNLFDQNTLHFAKEVLEAPFRSGKKEWFKYTPTLIYADVHPWHLLFNRKKQKLQGIIDFGDVEIGDPDYEFLRIYDSYGWSFVKRLLQYYKHPNQRKLLQKLQLFTQYNALEDVHIGARRNDKETLAWAKGKLRKAMKRK